MNTKKWLLIMSVFVLLSGLLAACSSSPDSPKFQGGKFVKANTSDYGLELNEDKTFTIFSGGYTLVRGTYSVEGDRLIEESNTGGCPSPVRFKYEFDGTKLTLQYEGNPMDDPCEGRRADFNNQTYILSK